MISKSGCIYFFSCHALLGVLNVYDVYRHMNKVTHWSHEYETMTNWLMEEIVFPAEYENLMQNEHIKLQDLGEVLGDWTFQLFSVENDADVDISHYLVYLSTLEAITLSFINIMESNLSKENTYYHHYKNGLANISNLQKALNQAIKQTKLNLDNNIENTSQSSIITDWVNEIYSNTNKFSKK